MKQFWVIGGEYADTGFERIAPGARLERYGPFSTEKEALDEWSKRSWRTVDKCHFRYTVVKEGDDAQGRLSGERADPQGQASAA